MSDFSKLKPALVLRRMPRNGVNSSEEINDFIEQSIHDVAGIYNFVNQVVIPAFNGLGQTGTWSDIDAIANGIDGSTLMVDRDYSDTSSPYFYHSSKNRPRTILESLLIVVNDLDRAFVGINEVKARLGTTTEDPSVPTSQATLSEIETKVNYLNSLVTQIKNANASYLTAAEIEADIEDLVIDPSSFHILDADIDANVGIAATKISGVDLTAAATYVFLPSTYDNQDTILRVKEWIEDITGEVFTSYTSSNVTAGSTTKAHIDGLGTGTPTATNVHGLDVGDLTDAGGLLSPPQLIADFTIVSGVINADGGYVYVPSPVTATKITLTVGRPASTGLSLTIYKRRAGSNSSIGSLSVGIGSTPGSDIDTISVDLIADDLLFCGNYAGDGTNAKVQVFGHI